MSEGSSLGVSPNLCTRRQKERRPFQPTAVPGRGSAPANFAPQQPLQRPARGSGQTQPRARSSSSGSRWTKLEGRTEAQRLGVGHPSPLESGLSPSGLGGLRRPGRRRGRGRRWTGRGPAFASHAGAHRCLRHRQGGEEGGRRAVRSSPGLPLTSGRR